MDALIYVLEQFNIPTIPALAAKILALSQDENAFFETGDAILKKDMGLTAKLLMYANAPSNGLLNEAGNVKEAMKLLGLKRAKKIALSFSLADAIKPSGLNGLDGEHFWLRSLIANRSIEFLTDNSQDRDDAEIAALLQDIGI